MKEIIIDETNSDQRLDKFLKRILSEASTSFIYKMLRKKNITLNNKKADGSEKVAVGDSIKIFFSDETFDKMTGKNKVDPYYNQLKMVDSRINIIYEDDDLMILNKPAGILSQKSTDNDISINEMALSYLINSNKLSDDDFKKFHPSVVNRLDRNTTGIILFAKNLKSSQYLSLALKDRSVVKMYHAIVCGKIEGKKLIEGYLYKDETTNKVSIFDTKVPGSKLIKTEYELIRRIDNDLSLIAIHLITGRSHQIRAHLASIGCPILGDFKYGNHTLNKKYNVKHQLLHAYSIEFENGKKYVANEPEEFKKLENK